MRADAEALYNANQRGLFRYFCRAVGHAETARDLTQDVFVRVSRSVIPAAPEAALRGWLFQIARNLALDHHRRGQRRPQAEPLTDTARPASQDTGAEVNEALASLADVDRDVFLMREVAGLGYDEIATACGLTPDAVRSRIHRARLQLRDRLSSQIAARRAAPMRQSAKSQQQTHYRIDNSHDRHAHRHFSFHGRRTLRCRGARRGVERSGGAYPAHRPGGAPSHRPAGRAGRNRSGRNIPLAMAAAARHGRDARRPGRRVCPRRQAERRRNNPSRRRRRGSCRKPHGKILPTGGGR